MALHRGYGVRDRGGLHDGEMVNDDALLASVMRKLASTPHGYFYLGDGLLTVDGDAVVTPEEDAAIERMYEQEKP